MRQVKAQLLGFDQNSLFLEWSVLPPEGVRLPPQGRSERADGLWKATCFEVFLKSAGSDAYLELNFSPSFEWAAYAFDRYRDGMRQLPLRLEPEVWISQASLAYCLSAEFDISQFVAEPVLANFTAVIEEKDGTKSYWALAHPPDGPPDFHHPDCFVLELPPPSAA